MKIRDYKTLMTKLQKAKIEACQKYKNAEQKNDKQLKLNYAKINLATDWLMSYLHLLADKD